MTHPSKIFGRFGNQMFQYATLIALAYESGTDAYFQDVKWFGKYEDQIKQLFGAGIGYRDEVSIHVRRGDYLQLEHHYPNLSKTDYYEKAIAMFPYNKFLVFSDDIEWCKSYPAFQGERFSFSEGRDEVQDLNQMASCQHNILANSTFSWWGAYLNKNKDKMVVCPRPELWLNNISLLDSWIKI